MSGNGNGGMGGEHFSDFMTRERERLEPSASRSSNSSKELQRKLDEINREFTAIEAYEAAKTGKATRGGGVSPGRQTRVRRGSRREELLNLIREGMVFRGSNPGTHGAEGR